jgi:hypothetical protein
MTRATTIGLALVIVATTAACGGSTSNSTIPTPTGTLVTDTFTNVVPMGGLAFNNFTVTTGGTVNVTLVSAGPPPTITMELGIGTPSATGTCSLLSGAATAATASTTAQLSGTLNAGSYCVEVLDLGNAAGPITYTVTVAHT